MSADLWLSNLVSWWLQTAVVVTVAGILLRLVPVRAPRVLLVYLQTLLGVCLLLPVLEPLRAIPVDTRISAKIIPGFGASTSSGWSIPLPNLALAVIAIGIGARLVWLTAGYWKLRRYHVGASPAGGEVASLQETLGVSAQVYVSPEISGAVTFGLWRPTVLLPARWPELDPVTRYAVACHELLHAQRNDWAFHIAEELIRALFWFHPAIWWLTDEVRLAREQVVDRMVARLISAPKAYAQTLLAFAGIESHLAAPAFTGKRHLARRIQSILEEVSMTKSRLLVSLGSITLCMSVAGAIAVWSFPLESVKSTLITSGGPSAGIVGGVESAVPGGVAGAVIAGVPGGVNGGVNGGVIGGVVGGVPGARTVAAQKNPKLYKVGEDGVTSPQVIQKVDPEYTPQARDAKIEGTVVLKTEIHADGRAHNTRVVRSLDRGLDRNAVDAVSNWQFAPATKDGVAVSVQASIEVNFRLN